ncbi:hypothetical protein CA831_14375, partial [Burkholderia multivorans]
MARRAPSAACGDGDAEDPRRASDLSGRDRTAQAVFRRRLEQRRCARAGRARRATRRQGRRAD